ncbi:MAG: hypothetical protein AW07_00694 [Candidatus Accumulibacter sp. SK-11]|nr:MAG: hypothetical protein AW07_00694 [Candidatus Accumulibacter sp. SK-11]
MMTSGSSGPAAAAARYNQRGKSVRQPLGKRCKPGAERKVRAPQSTMPVNDRAPQGDGKCNRKQTADVPAQAGAGKGETVR